MYEYGWYQWLAFFYIYCFFGWIFESTYVSVKKGHFVNRGFLRLPMLPIYGTGAVMMLWVSLPVRDSLLLVYTSGAIAATILEYVTGWGMERLFKVKYWDYSNQRFQLNGYICLSSTIAWGFLTVLLTEVLHPPIARYVLGIPLGVLLVCVGGITVLFVLDAVQSVKEALDLAKVLDAMTNMRAELDDLQVQMALLKAEMQQRAAESRDESLQRLELLKSQAEARTAALREEASARTAALKDEAAARTTAAAEAAASRLDAWKNSAEERAAALSRRLEEVDEKRQNLAGRMNFYRKGLLRGNPSASSARFAEALKELREMAEKRR
ncbi:MAG TPA: hypothetical protein H9704_08915 [Candidatus Enterocloster excrementipullorum]|uniref:ABC transporter permease n=1 Tax=Candidatus Enterocloster excrementipullorum TaxID=2838559 RepID=A0A9D2MZL5_9FIRM|nr:hypothetical protein [Candidatus Enterocloster excrementipullorum]